MIADVIEKKEFVSGKARINAIFYNNGSVDCYFYESKQTKKAKYYKYFDLEAFNKAKFRFFNMITEKIAKKEAVRAERTKEQKERLEEYKNKLSIGSIIVYSWGYEQTNVSAYEIVDLQKDTVKMRRISTMITKDGGFMSEYVIPVPGDYIEELVTKKITARGIRFDYGSGEIWDGKREYYVSHYA